MRPTAIHYFTSNSYKYERAKEYLAQVDTIIHTKSYEIQLLAASLEVMQHRRLQCKHINKSKCAE